MTENDPAPSEPAPSEPAIVMAPGTTRRRWPWWLWVLVIGVPLLLLLSLKVVGAAFLSDLLLSQATRTLICYADGGCGLGASPQPTPSGTGDQVDSVDHLNHIPLDGNAVFDGRPVWSLTLDPTWQALDLDLVGITVFQDDVTGCELITSQTVSAPTAEEVRDAVHSADLLNQEVKAITAGNPEALVINPGSLTDIPIVAAESGSTIDFTSATISQKNADGVSISTEIVARSMPHSDAALVALLTCETATFATFGDEFDFFSTALAVTVSP